MPTPEDVAIAEAAAQEAENQAAAVNQASNQILFNTTNAIDWWTTGGGDADTAQGWLDAIAGIEDGDDYAVGSTENRIAALFFGLGMTHTSIAENSVLPADIATAQEAAIAAFDDAVLHSLIAESVFVTALWTAQALAEAVQNEIAEPDPDETNPDETEEPPGEDPEGTP